MFAARKRLGGGDIKGGVTMGDIDARRSMRRILGSARYDGKERAIVLEEMLAEALSEYFPRALSGLDEVM